MNKPSVSYCSNDGLSQLILELIFSVKYFFLDTDVHMQKLKRKMIPKSNQRTPSYKNFSKIQPTRIKHP